MTTLEVLGVLTAGISYSPIRCDHSRSWGAMIIPMESPIDSVHKRLRLSQTQERQQGTVNLHLGVPRPQQGHGLMSEEVSEEATEERREDTLVSHSPQSGSGL